MRAPCGMSTTGLVSASEWRAMCDHDVDWPFLKSRNRFLRYTGCIRERRGAYWIEPVLVELVGKAPAVEFGSVLACVNLSSRQLDAAATLLLLSGSSSPRNPSEDEGKREGIHTVNFVPFLHTTSCTPSSRYCIPSLLALPFSAIQIAFALAQVSLRSSSDRGR